MSATTDSKRHSPPRHALHLALVHASVTEHADLLADVRPAPPSEISDQRPLFVRKKKQTSLPVARRAGALQRLLETLAHRLDTIGHRFDFDTPAHAERSLSSSSIQPTDETALDFDANGPLFGELDVAEHLGDEPRAVDRRIRVHRSDEDFELRLDALALVLIFAHIRPEADALA